MSSRRLDRMGLDDFTVERLADRGIKTAKDLLEISPLVVMMYLDLSLVDANKIIMQASARIASTKSSSALELLQARSQKIYYGSTGIKGLDAALRGGLNIGTITEICGPPGVGKTQFCIGCCVQTVYRGSTTTNSSSSKKGGVIYIDTELKFDPVRLIDVAACRFPETYSTELNEDATRRIDNFLDSVKIIRPMTCRELLKVIDELQPLVIEEGIELIILDSIASLARKEGLNEVDKEQFIIGQAAALKRIAELCHCSVLVTNQITVDAYKDPINGKRDRDRDGNEDNPLGDGIRDIGGSYRPTLGTAWHHCVSTRLTMHTEPYRDWVEGFSEGGDSANCTAGRGSGQGVGEGEGRGYEEEGVKVLSLTKSPIAAPCQLPFRISRSGLEERIELIRAPR